MIRTFFGNPGCGKTTLLCKMALKNQKRYSEAVTNFKHNVPGACYYESLEGLGSWVPPDNLWFGIDEAGIDFNNRSYKSMALGLIAYLKKHRHLYHDIDVFSQSWDDIDITIRRLSVDLWHMRKLGPWTLCRRVYKRTEVDQTTHQIIDGYKMASMAWLLVFPLQLGFPFEKKFTLTFRPFYYKYFDSYEFDRSIPVKLPTKNAR